MRLIVLALLALTSPAHASTLSFEWISISKEIVSNGNDTGFPYKEVVNYPDRIPSTYFSFDLPGGIADGFEYAASHSIWSDTEIEKNPLNATLSYLREDHYFAEGKYSISLKNGIVDMWLSMYDGGDHFFYYDNTSISIDHNQGDIFESYYGYWRAVSDNVVLGVSAPDLENPVPIPVPASLPLLLIGLGAFMVKRRLVVQNPGD